MGKILCCTHQHVLAVWWLAVRVQHKAPPPLPLLTTQPHRTNLQRKLLASRGKSLIGSRLRKSKRTCHRCNTILRPL